MINLIYMCRILSTGGARVVDINLDIVTSTRNIPAGLTHLFTENHFQSQLSTVAKNSVHCVTADYIGDFVIKVRHCQFRVPVSMCD